MALAFLLVPSQIPVIGLFIMPLVFVFLGHKWLLFALPQWLYTIILFGSEQIRILLSTGFETLGSLIFPIFLIGLGISFLLLQYFPVSFAGLWLRRKVYRYLGDGWFG